MGTAAASERPHRWDRTMRWDLMICRGGVNPSRSSNEFQAQVTTVSPRRVQIDEGVVVAWSTCSNHILLNLRHVQFRKWLYETWSKEWHARCIDHVRGAYIPF
jgi:hypothetical protein